MNARRSRPAPGARTRERTVVTPEGIALTLTVATRGARVGALMLDLLFLILIIAGMTVALIQIGGGALASAVPGGGNVVAGALQFLGIVWIAAMFLLRYAYFLFFELGARGATPGKRLAGIRVAARDGGRLTAEMVVARNLLRDVELFMPIAVLATAGASSGAGWLLVLGWLAIFTFLPLFNRDRLRAGDVVAGSWVVERPGRKLEAALTLPAAPGGETAAAPAGAGSRAYVFTDAELDAYGEFELQALERVLRENRAKSLETVAEKIAARIGRAYPWDDERRFLEAYYAQLRARLEAGMRMGRRKADKHSEQS